MDQNVQNGAAPVQPVPQPPQPSVFTPPAPPQPKPAFRYDRWELFAALGSLLFGYLFCRAFPFGEYPLGGAITLLVLGAGYTVLMGAMRKLNMVFSKLVCGFLAVLAVSLLLQSGELARFLTSVLFFFLLFYSLARNFGATTENKIGKNFFYDAVVCVFVLPFRNFGNFFAALFHPRTNGDPKRKKTVRTVLWILLGVLIALIPAAIAVALLSYDASFMSLMRKIFRLDLDKIFSHAFSIFLAFPIGALIFSVFFCAKRGRCKSVMNGEKAERFREKCRFLPIPLATGIFLPMLAVYFLFFVSQADYYLSSLRGQLPGGITYADYARDGFFNLCWVAVFNAVFLLVMYLFTKKKEGGQSSLSERIVSALLALSTLLVIVTATAKMILYVNAYGLTIRRVLVMWLLALLFVSFLCVILRQFIRKMNLPAALFVIGLVFWAVIGLCDLRAVVADYNADAYLSGRLNRIDLDTISDLGDSGVPALVRLTEAGAADRYGNTARDRLRSTRAYRAYLGWESDTSVFSYDLARLRAERAISRVGESLKEPGDDAMCRINLTWDADLPVESVTAYWHRPAGQAESQTAVNADGSLMTDGCSFDILPIQGGSRIEFTVVLSADREEGEHQFYWSAPTSDEKLDLRLNLVGGQLTPTLVKNG